MDFLKKAVISFFCGMILGAAWWIGGSAEVAAPEGYYPLSGKIVEIDKEKDYFVVLDGSGFLWEIGEVEDFEVGDGVAIIMWNAGTTTILDDEVVMCHYAGKEVW